MYYHSIAFIVFFGAIIFVMPIKALRNGNIVVATSVSENSLIPSRSAFATRHLEGLQFWAQWANKNGGVNVSGINYKFEIYSKEDNDNLDFVLQNYNEFVNDNEVDFLMAPFGSGYSVPVSNEITEPRKRLLVGLSTSATEFYLNKTYSYSVSPSLITGFAIAVRFYRSHGFKSVTEIVFDDFGGNNVCGGFKQIAEENGIAYKKEIFAAKYVQDEGEAKNAAERNWTNIVDEIININADGLVVCALPPQYGLQYMIDVMYQRNWLPKSLTTSPLSNEWDIFDKKYREFITGYAVLSEKSRFKGDFFGNTTQFKQTVTDNFNVTGGIEDGFALSVVGGLALQTAINNSQSLNDTDLAEAFLRLNMNTFYGRIHFDVNHGQLVENVLVQFVNNTANVVGPLLSATSNIVLPVPTWDERKLSNKFGSYISEWIIFVAVVLCILQSLLFGFYIYLNRRTPVIMAASKLFLTGIVVGSILLYVSVIVWTPNNNETLFCHLRVWLMNIGLGILYGCLFAKTWRVYRIFKGAESLKIVVISNYLILAYVGIFTGGLVVLCIGYSAFLDESHIEIVDTYRPSKNYLECTNTTTSLVIFGIQLALWVMLYVFGAFVGCRVQRVPLKIFNESKVLGLVSYNLAFFFCTAAIVQVTVRDHSTRDTQFIIRSICVLIMGAGTVSLLFYHKAKLLGKNRKEALASMPSITDQLESSTTTVGVQKYEPQETELQKLQKENERLVKRLKELELDLGN